jgi:phage terminase small subunit
LSILPVFLADFDKMGRMIVPAKLKSETPTKPSGLSAEASAHWDEILPEVEQRCILYKLHGSLLEILCESFAMYERLRVIYRDSFLSKDANGKFIKTPYKRYMIIALRTYNQQRQNFHLKPLPVPRVR